MQAPLMQPSIVLTCALLLLAAGLAGCLGGDDLDDVLRAQVSVDPVAGEPDTYRFDASGSTGAALRFAWDLGDWTLASDPVVKHHYAYGSGVYTARLVATDAHGRADTWEEEIVVGDGENGSPEAAFALGKRIYRPDEPVRVDASASTDPESDPLEYHWDFNHRMDTNAYEAFRVAKDGGGNGAADPEGDAASQDGEATAPSPELLRRDESGVREPRLLGTKNGNHNHGGTPTITPSAFHQTVVTKDPVYVLESGFPDETTFFIRVQVFDVKGAAAPIRSEEIWAVEVVGEPPARFASDSRSGVFTFGAPAPADEHLAHVPGNLTERELRWDFELEWPVKELRVNVTFDPGPEDPTGQLPVGNALALNGTAPNGVSWFAQGTGGRLSLHWLAQDEPGVGWWKTHLVARHGVQIEYEIEYWAVLDLNPFHAHE